MQPPPRRSSVTSGWPDVTDRRHIQGTATVRRARWWSFPATELVQADEVLALLGRSGWLRILIGAGQRIEFPDGDRWRLRSVSIGGSIGLVVLDGSDRKVAMASFSGGAYSITGRDFGCVLVPGDARRRRAHRWMVRHGEDELAAVTKVPLSIHAFEPLPLGVVLLCLVLVRSGIPGESPVKLPKFRW